MNYKIKTIPIFISIFIFSLSGTSLCAQDSQKSLAIKLYTNFLRDNTGELTETQFGYFSPALAINLPNGNFHEIELSRLRPFLGFSVNPYYSYLRYKPMVSSSFPSRGHILGANFSLIPRIKYFLNDKCFVDLNIPINLVGMRVQNVRVENPTLQENERTTSTVEFSEFPAIFQFRIGLGLTL